MSYNMAYVDLEEIELTYLYPYIKKMRVKLYSRPL
jgi:hypothetical protein